MKTRDFGKVIQQKLASDPELAKAVEEASAEGIQEQQDHDAVICGRFAKAIRHFLVGLFTKNGGTLWEAYRDNIYDIEVDDLPHGEVRELWKWVQNAVHDRIEKNISRMIGEPVDRWSNSGPRHTAESAREELWKDNALDNMGHSRIKKIKLMLFDIYVLLSGGGHGLAKVDGDNHAGSNVRMGNVDEDQADVG